MMIVTIFFIFLFLIIMHDNYPSLGLFGLIYVVSTNICQSQLGIIHDLNK